MRFGEVGGFTTSSRGCSGPPHSSLWTAKSVKHVTYWRVPVHLGCDTLTGQNQQIRWNMETLAQALYHRHAQFALARHDLADAARRTQKRHKIGARQAMLLHQIG